MLNPEPSKYCAQDHLHSDELHVCRPRHCDAAGLCVGRQLSARTLSLHGCVQHNSCDSAGEYFCDKDLKAHL
jgi:hypothetical protein